MVNNKILVWDFPTRVYHWLQAFSFIVAYLISDTEKYRDLHIALGYIMLGLIIFRIIWGFFGSRYARFDSFLFGPFTILNHLKAMAKGNPPHYTGHSPAGSGSIWMMLALGLVVCITGVLTLDDNASDFVIELHGMATNVMLVIIGLHLGGVVISSIQHKENLARAMVTGYKQGKASDAIPTQTAWLGIVILIIAAVFSYYYLQQGN